MADIDFTPLYQALSKSKQDSRDEERLNMEKRRDKEQRARWKAEMGEAQIEPEKRWKADMGPAEIERWQTDIGPAQIEPEKRWQADIGEARIEGKQPMPIAPPMLYRPQLQQEMSRMGDQGGMRAPPPAQAPPAMPPQTQVGAPGQPTLSVEDKLRALGYY